MPASPRMMKRARFFSEKVAQRGHVVRTELFTLANGQLKCSTLEMVNQNLEVVRVDVCVLRRAFEEVLRVFQDVLVQRRAGSDQHRERRGLTPAGPSRALPRGCNGARVSGHHHRVERSDVDAQLQGVRGHYCSDLAAAKFPLDLAALA